MQEFNKLESEEQMMSWLKKELIRRNVGESRLMAAMDADRSGTVYAHSYAHARAHVFNRRNSVNMAFASKVVPALIARALTD